MPKAARDRIITTTTQPAPNALDHQYAQDQKRLAAAHQGGGHVWHVDVHTMQPAPTDGVPFVEVSFRVMQLPENGALVVIGWTLSGDSDLRLSESSRFPLRTYARAAVLAVADAIEEADGAPYDEIVAKHRRYPKGFDITAGRLVDQHTRQVRGAPKRAYAQRVNGAHRRDLGRIADEYRQAIDRGSRSPTIDVAHALTVSRSTAARAIRQARELGLLGAALRTAAGEQRN